MKSYVNISTLRRTLEQKAAMTYIPTSDLAQNRWEPSPSIIIIRSGRKVMRIVRMGRTLIRSEIQTVVSRCMSVAIRFLIIGNVFLMSKEHL